MLSSIVNSFATMRPPASEGGLKESRIRPDRCRLFMKSGTFPAAGIFAESSKATDKGMSVAFLTCCRLPRESVPDKIQKEHHMKDRSTNGRDFLPPATLTKQTTAFIV
jgi:hypothetical protein